MQLNAMMGAGRLGGGSLGGGPLGGSRMRVGHLGGTGRNKCGTLGRLGGTRFVRSIWRPGSRESLLPEPPSLPGTLLHPGTWSTALPAL